MHLTCIQGDENSLRVLFMAKANCSVGDMEQRTPIHLAAERGFTKLVDFLIEKFKASIYDRTKDGSTLMHIAAINGHPETAVLLFNKVQVHKYFNLSLSLSTASLESSIYFVFYINSTIIKRFITRVSHFSCLINMAPGVFTLLPRRVTLMLSKLFLVKENKLMRKPQKIKLLFILQ